MTDGTPDDRAWLAGLVARSPYCPSGKLRRHWQRVMPWLSRSQRYELAATLLDIEHTLRRAPPDPSTPGPATLAPDRDTRHLVARRRVLTHSSAAW